MPYQNTSQYKQIHKVDVPMYLLKTLSVGVPKLRTMRWNGECLMMTTVVSIPGGNEESLEMNFLLLILHNVVAV